MMSVRVWYAPAVLFALQVAPVSVTTDSVGRIRLSFGGGVGSYQERDVNCAGEVLDSYKVPFQQVGGQIDAWASKEVRVTAYGGAMFASSSRPAAERFNPLYEGGYGGALVAGEWRSVGFGAGLSAIPTADLPAEGAMILPAAYFRLGTLDKVHFRLDVSGPPGPGAPPHIARIGLGFGQGHVRRSSGIVALEYAPYPHGEISFGLLSQLLFPVSRTMDLGGTVAIREGFEGGPGYSLGAMIRVNLGQPSR